MEKWREVLRRQELPEEGEENEFEDEEEVEEEEEEEEEDLKPISSHLGILKGKGDVHNVGWQAAFFQEKRKGATTKVIQKVI